MFPQIKYYYFVEHRFFSKSAFLSCVVSKYVCLNSNSIEIPNLLKVNTIFIAFFVFFIFKLYVQTSPFSQNNKKIYASLNFSTFKYQNVLC